MLALCAGLLTVLASTEVLVLSRGLRYWLLVWGVVAGSIACLRVGWLPAAIWSMIAGIVSLGFFLALNFKVVRVEGRSMQPTFAQGDVLLVDMLEPPETRFGVYVIESGDGGGAQLVKRLVGLPGDTMHARYGRIFADGLEVYPRDGSAPDTWYEDRPARALIDSDGLTLSEQSLYFMGDNPPESRDSRQLGPQDAEAVQGRVVWRLKGTGGFGPFVK